MAHARRRYSSLLRNMAVSASSVLVSRRISPISRKHSNLDFLRFLPGNSSTVISSPSLMALAIVSISRSIILTAANVTNLNLEHLIAISGSLSLSRSKLIRMLLGQHLTFSFILKFTSTRSESIATFGTREGYYVCPADDEVESLLNQDCNGRTHCNTIWYV